MAGNRSKLAELRRRQAEIASEIAQLEAPVSPFAPERFPALPPVEGVRLSSAAAGVRYPNRTDVMLAELAAGSVIAGTFTRSETRSAPVLWCQERIAALAARRAGKKLAIVVNSGNANAFTGRHGREAVEAVMAATGRVLGVPAGNVLMASTGVIGEPLAAERVTAKLEELAAGLSAGGLEGAARAIMTTDTYAKGASAVIDIDGVPVTISGFAKGSGMIAPDMATMLGFIATDASIAAAALRDMLSAAVKVSFNAITVDGDMSTNDTVLVLANGESGVALDERSKALFQEALHQVCDCLADKIVADGERITKVVEILVSGGASDRDAENIARVIGNSLLVKTSWYGNDPNWGRLMDALGYADAQIDQYVIDISYDDVPALVSGNPIPENKPNWKEVVSKSRFSIRIDMHQGNGKYRLRASDLTEGYVDFNKSE